jgi:hypothetical protein
VALDEESRYALLKLADPRREPAKLEAALIELGLLEGAAPPLSSGASACEAQPHEEPASGGRAGPGGRGPM